MKKTLIIGLLFMNSACVTTPIEPEIDKSELNLVAGFRSADDVCKVVGKDPKTDKLKELNNILVACPIGYSAGINELINKNKGIISEEMNNYLLINVPNQFIQNQ